MATWFYHVSPHMPERLVIKGKLAPGYVVIMPDKTGLSKPLLVMHPNQETMVRQAFEGMLEPVTQADWDKATQRNVMKWAKDVVEGIEND